MFYLIQKMSQIIPLESIISQLISYEKSLGDITNMTARHQGQIICGDGARGRAGLTVQISHKRILRNLSF